MFFQLVANTCINPIVDISLIATGFIFFFHEIFSRKRNLKVLLIFEQKEIIR